MIYLSRLFLNPRNYRVQRDLSDCHELHRTVLSAFPHIEGDGARDKFGVLHRVDQQRSALALLVKSDVKPDWSDLPEGYLLASGNENPAIKRIDGSYERITAGLVLAFLIRANPTKRLRTQPTAGQKEKGKRVDLRREEDRIDWLRRKGDVCGFRIRAVRAHADVPDVRVVPGERATGNRDGTRVAFGAVTFEGELEVVDANRFQEALSGGIGSGKAYGFGLLSVAPAR